MTKDVVKKEDKPVAIATMYEDDTSYTQETTAEDFAIPFITILQQLSPQCKKNDGAFIKGAEEGMMMNTVTGEMWDEKEGIMVVPVAYEKKLIEWKDRDTGGGLVKIHDYDPALLERTIRNDKNKDVTPDGTILETTAQYYVLLVDETGRYEPAMISMTSTQLKKSRKWNSIMQNIQMEGKNGLFNPPWFSHMYHLTTVPEAKDSYSWSGWKIEQKGPVTNPDVYAAAKEFFSSVKRGDVKTSDPVAENSAGDDKKAQADAANI